MAQQEWKKTQVKIAKDSPKIPEIVKAVLANEAFDDVTVWALQAFCIDPNPVMFYRATHTINEKDSPATIAKKAAAFTGSSMMQAAVKACKKDMASKDFLALSLRKKIMADKEVQLIEEMMDNEQELPPISKDDAIKYYERRVHVNKHDAEAWGELAKLGQWTKTSNNDDENNEEDIYSKVTHVYLPFSCATCERKGTSLCSGCSIEKESEGLLTDEELETAKQLANNTTR